MLFHSCLLAALITPHYIKVETTIVTDQCNGYNRSSGALVVDRLARFQTPWMAFQRLEFGVDRYAIGPGSPE